VDRVTDSPHKVDNRKSNYVCATLKVKVCKEQNGKYWGSYRAYCNPHFKFTPTRMCIIYDKPHERIVKSVKNTGGKNNSSYPPHCICRQIDYVSKVEHKEHTDYAVNHVPADCPKTESYPVANISILHNNRLYQ
jgi:hypothetical protein